MAVIKKKGSVQPEWIASRDYNAFTVGISNTSAVTAAQVQTVDGRKLIRSGTLVKFSVNPQIQSQGLLMETIDVTHGETPGSVMLTGYYYAERLPYQLSAAAQDSLAKVGIKRLPV